MSKVWVVKVRSWDESYNMIDFSIHRTEEGAKAAVEKAKKAYATDNVTYDEVVVED